MTKDKKTIGLTPENKMVMDKIKTNFSDQMDAAKFAMTLAIKAGRELGEGEAAETVWNIGSFDPDGEIRDLIRALFPSSDAPYRSAEFLIQAGLQIINEHLKASKELDVVRLIQAVPGE